MKRFKSIGRALRRGRLRVSYIEQLLGWHNDPITGIMTPQFVKYLFLRERPMQVFGLNTKYNFPHIIFAQSAIKRN